LSSPMIRNWIWIRMLVPKAVTVRAPTYLPTPSRTTPISHTLPCSRRVPVLAPMVTYARDGTIEVQTNDDGGSEARREPELAC
jgi:hypothetical protein